MTIRTIAHKEFIEMWRDDRFRVAAVIVLILLVTALGAGWRHYRNVSAERAAAQMQMRENWLGQGKKNPHGAAHYGTYAFKPMLPLGLVDSGTDAYTGAALYLEAHKQNNAKYLAAQDRTSLQRFGELTAAVVLQVLLPLVIVLLGFAAFAGERETGTLRQLLSLGVKPHDLAFGKALGISGALLLLLVPASVVGATAIILSGANGQNAAFDAPRLLVMSLGYVLYLAGFIGLALAASAFFRAARTALIVLLGFWVINCLIAPRVAADLSERVAPVPSSAQFWTNIADDLRNGLDGHNPQDKRARELLDKTLKEYGVAKVEDLPVNFSGISLQAGEAHSDRVFDKHFNHLWDGYERQSRIQQWSGLVAPLLAVRSLSMGMAASDFAHHRRFAHAAEVYRREMVKKLNLDIAFNSKAGQTYLQDEKLWSQVPDFAYAPPPASWAVARQTGSLMALAAWLVASGLLAFFAVRRIRVN